MSWVFDDMDGKFDARLRRVFPTTRSTKNGDKEIVVSNFLGTVEAKFDFSTLDRSYSPSFVAVERPANGGTSYLIFEVVAVNPIHFQMLGMDVSMPTVLRREYLDTISESWGKSQETWIDLGAVPTWYSMTIEGDEPKFQKSRLLPLAGAKVRMLSNKAVERFLCYDGGETIGEMTGFDMPLRINLDNLIRFHSGTFAFSLDHDEPIIYKENGSVRITEIGRLVDRFFGRGDEEGRRYTNSIEVISFDPETYNVNWTPIQYVFRHENQENLLRFKMKTGRNVAVTPGHSIFVLRRGRILCLPASEVAVGDHVVGTRAIPNLANSNLKVNMVDMFRGRLAGEVFMIGVPQTAFGRLARGKVPNWKWWRWRQLEMLPLTYWDALSADEQRAIKLGYKHASVSLSPVLEVDEDVASLLGYYTSEGNVTIKRGLNYKVTFTLNKDDQKILRELPRILERKFGINARKFRHGDNGMRITFNNKVLAYFLREIAKTGAGKKIVPSVILNSPFKVRQAFIRAWAEGDYPTSSSRRLTNDLLYALLFDSCAGAVNWIVPKKGAVIEGRMLPRRGRYQFSFPRAREMKGTIRPTRRRAEPSYPAGELPLSLNSLLLQPSHVKRSRARLGRSLLSEMEARLNKLMSCEGSACKSADEAREDGYYRTGMKTFLIRENNLIHASPALLQASKDIEQVKLLQQSSLGFFEVQQIETVRPSSKFVYDVSVPGRENFLAGFGGIFCHNTGSGKSNLTSSLIRKVVGAYDDVTIVIFDVAGEYVTHLVDLVEAQGRIFSDETIDDAEQLLNSQVVPESLETLVGQEKLLGAFSKIFQKGSVKKLALTEKTSQLTLSAVENILSKVADEGKAGSAVAMIALDQLASTLYRGFGLQPSTRFDELDDDAKRELIALLDDVRKRSHEKSGIRMEADTFIQFLETSTKSREPGEGEREAPSVTPAAIARDLANGRAARLNILYLPDPVRARMVAHDLINTLLFLRKRGGSRKRVLIVLDEAQEYIPDNPRDKDNTLQSNQAVEQLLRQGRKYRVHCWLATQRVAHLNVSALQQLHSYFVSTLPRFYDRMVIAESFALPYEVLEKTTQLETGEWIFVSYKATKQKNVPVFLRTENNEKAVEAFLR